MNRLSDDYRLHEAPYWCSDDPPEYAEWFGTIEKGKWYFKKVRTSRMTTGVCHRIELDVRREGQDRWDKNGKRTTLGPLTTREVAGLQNGRFHGYSTDIGGLVTSMDEVLASIQAKTGGSLSLP